MKFHLMILILNYGKPKIVFYAYLTFRLFHAKILKAAIYTKNTLFISIVEQIDNNFTRIKRYKW